MLLFSLGSLKADDRNTEKKEENHFLQKHVKGQRVLLSRAAEKSKSDVLVLKLMRTHTVSITADSSCAAPMRHSKHAVTASDWQPGWECCCRRRRRRWRLERGRGEVGGERHSSLDKVKETACQFFKWIVTNEKVSDRGTMDFCCRHCVCCWDGKMCGEEKTLLKEFKCHVSFHVGVDTSASAQRQSAVHVSFACS